MATVYKTCSGKVIEHELIKETPKGFRFKNDYFKGSSMIFYTSCVGYTSFQGIAERTNIASLDKSMVDSHAKAQRDSIRQRVAKYSDYELSRIEGLD